MSLRDLAATIVDVLGSRRRFPISRASRWPGSGRIIPRSPPSPPLRIGPLAEVVPLDLHDPDPAQLLKPRWPLAALTEGDWTYIRREGEVSRRAVRLREDAKELHNLAADPAQQPTLERMRDALGHLTAGPLTPQRFNP